jgi:thiol-disulfide isomerase/thioredoxin
MRESFPLYLLMASTACSSPRDAEIPFDGEPLPDFALADLNPNSESYEESISPRDTTGSVSVWYFTHATCGYCQSQFDILYILQEELDVAYGDGAVEIYGINGAGYEDGIPDITDGNTLPLLQDTDELDVWGAWYADWRDLVVLDVDNAWIGLFNLTTHDLSDPSNLTEVREMVDRGIPSR